MLIKMVAGLCYMIVVTESDTTYVEFRNFTDCSNTAEIIRNHVYGADAICFSTREE